MNIRRYIIKRLIQAVPMIFLASLLAFSLSQLSAGDTAELVLQSQGVRVTEENLNAKRKELGLDKPIHEQYISWLSKAVKLDFGISFYTRRPVIEEMERRFLATLQLSVAAAVFSLILAVPIALLSVRYQNRWLDHFFRTFTTAAATMPDYWVGLLLLYLFAVKLDLFPVVTGSKIENIFLPAFTLCLGPSASYIRILRDNLIRIQTQNYMKAARAKGLSKNSALIRHGLKNAIVPCLSLFANNFGNLMSGCFACETIFSWNGMGKFAIESVKMKDYPVMQFYIMVVAGIYILVNLVIDVIYVCLNSRAQIG